MSRGCIESTEDWRHSPCGVNSKRVQMICDNHYYNENGGRRSSYHSGVFSRPTRKGRGYLDMDDRGQGYYQKSYSADSDSPGGLGRELDHSIRDKGNEDNEASESIQKMFRCLSLEISPSLLDDPFGSGDFVQYSSPSSGSCCSRVLEYERISGHGFELDMGEDPTLGSLRSPYSHISMDPRYEMSRIFDRGGQELKEGDRDISTFIGELRAGRRKWTPYDVLEVVIELSRDQYGSRYIQKMLEESGELEKGLIFSKVVPHLMDLIVDVFGNYVIQRFIELGSSEHRRVILDKMKGEVYRLSFHTYGCRVVQKALECFGEEQQREIVSELKGRILECINDQNGNHVIQKCVEKASPSIVDQIIGEFRESICELTTHPYGCRVIQRVFEHCTYAQVSTLLKNISGSIVDLSKDQYGNYVVQYIFDRGGREEIESVASHVKGRVLELSRHKFASNVVEKFISCATEADLSAIIAEILLPDKTGELALTTLIKDQYGNYVIQKLLDSVGERDYDLLTSKIKAHIPTLKRSQYSKHIVLKIERLPNRK